MIARPEWWDEVVAWVGQYCDAEERAALNRLGADRELMRALSRQWKTKVPASDRESLGAYFVFMVTRALRTAREFSEYRHAQKVEGRRIKSIRGKLREVADELLRMHIWWAADHVLNAINELGEPGYDPVAAARTPHTAFMLELRNVRRFQGVVGDSTIARMASLLLGVPEDPDTLRTLYRRLRRKRHPSDV